MKKSLLGLVLLFASVSAFAQTWSLDKAHAKLGFDVTHLMVSSVEGSFKTFDVKVTSSKDEFADAAIELTADASSVYTDNEKRDEHLRSADFFEASKYPTLTFKSTSFTKAAGKKYTLVGDLTLHGVTKSVTLEATLNGTTVHPYSKKTIAGFKVSGTIKRSDFGVGKGTPPAVVSDEVTLNANLELIKD
ncbi:MAG TPA: YceI family protein [Chryseolinea sp.]|nr:YceI family protein [Chryseolinea sp.]